MTTLVLLRAALAVAAFLLTAGPVPAAELRVEPVLLELSEPAAATSLLVRNEETFDVGVQTRVFRWLQTDGTARLEPTADVAASPPIVRLAPGADYTIRIVRTSKQPVIAEESYRVIVDQLPDAQRSQRSSVAILVRQSIPVFFRARRLAPAHVGWSIRREADRLLVTGTNSGDERLRIASLSLHDTGGNSIKFGNGLVGYVLGRSAMSFIFPSAPSGFGVSGSVSLSADSNDLRVFAARSRRGSFVGRTRGCSTI